MLDPLQRCRQRLAEVEPRRAWQRNTRRRTTRLSHSPRKASATTTSAPAAARPSSSYTATRAITWSSHAWCPLLGQDVDVVTPDLRGYGKSDKHLEDVGSACSLTGQVDAVIALIDELGISNAVLCGYDVGTFTVQTIVMKRPDLAHSLVIAPPTLDVGRRNLEE
ncbi:alpha/beta fold hydrolase [Streptomyces olivaceoviridis]|uniref:alpha/beta fold hydrolase n=1 Tax=Streptomyces olivaceoviridis TaxID=1921 RepID=UPI00367B4A40